ncbi:MAG: HDIG domain-containing protein [Prevotella sp.]|nr:HDIG domain-containing protein [Prevotella sp.]
MENVNITTASELRRVLTTMLVWVVSVILIVIAIPNTEKPRLAYMVNEPWMSSQLISPGEILIQKDAKQVEQEQQEALRNEFVPYYTFDEGIGKRYVEAFLAKYGEGTDTVSAYLIQVVAEEMQKIYETGVMSQMDYSQMLEQDSLAAIMLVTNKEGGRCMVRDLYSIKSAYETLFTDSRLDGVRSALMKMDINLFIHPNIRYDGQRSEQAKLDILATIPTNSGVMKQGQEIINRGEIVTEEKARMIDSYNNFLSSRSDNELYMTNVLQMLYVVVLFAMFMFYMKLFRHDYLEKPRSLAMAFTLITIFPIMNSLVMRWSPQSIYIVPLCLAPMFIRVFLDSRTAGMTHLIIVLICAATVSEKFEFIVVQSMAGLVAIYELKELSKRSQIFVTAIMIFLSYIVTFTILKYMDNREVTFDALQQSYLCFVANGTLLLLTYPLMFLVEKMFGFVSPVTLFELSDTNRDLLRKLSEEAPGTFQHSIMVGNLAAAIATEVGAKSLLVRTGALYHDIGKMKHPVFFTENQSGVNPHTRLQPQDSARIIIGHVTEGLKIAEKNNIPDVIRVFIQTHHGKGLAKYFYNTYRNAHPDEEVDEKPFRYPGPNPFSQEQAILMMADAVEAASRSLNKYTEESISALVNKIIDSQVADGCFQDCPITFKDIATAKRVLIERLKTMYHTRIQYPELKK